MTDYRSTETTIRRTPSTVLVALAVAVTLLLGAAGCGVDTSSAAPAISTWSTSSDRQRESGVAAGAVPEGASVHDEIPAVANLDADLLEAVRRAAGDAAEEGIAMTVNSGWRSAAYQERLLREAVQEYGSQEEAVRWVASPEGSAHVSGNAIDVGPTVAANWLARHGTGYGLCQIYRNEPWHYELRADAVVRGCPPLYADPRQDPRTHR